MKNICPFAVLLATISIAACRFENSSQMFIPTAPADSGGTAGTTGSTPPSTSAGTGTPGFAGTWASSTIAGLPIGTCSNLRWVISEQSGSSVAGNLTATCAGGSTVTATLTGQVKSSTTLALTANGMITALGVPCTFNLEGTGARQGDDSMKLDYRGTYCLGAVSGTENLRRFPAVPSP
jgi:hypothetical protein